MSGLTHNSKHFRSLGRAFRKGHLSVDYRKLLGQVVPVIMRKTNSTKRNNKHYFGVRYVEYTF